MVVELGDGGCRRGEGAAGCRREDGSRQLEVCPRDTTVAASTVSSLSDSKPLENGAMRGGGETTSEMLRCSQFAVSVMPWASGKVCWCCIA